MVSREIFLLLIAEHRYPITHVRKQLASFIPLKILYMQPKFEVCQPVRAETGRSVVKFLDQTFIKSVVLSPA